MPPSKFVLPADDPLNPYVDPGFRNPVRIIYAAPPKCPMCGTIFEIKSIKPHWFPYIHVDVYYICPSCPTGKNGYIFGIPMAKDAGLSLQTWDTNPVDSVSKFREMGERKCPYGHGKMLPTKIFGDWLRGFKEVVEYQWKCPICFLVRHEEKQRDWPHGDAMTEKEPPLSEEEQNIIEERLRGLGYIQ